MKTKVLIMAAMIGMASAAKAQQTKDIKLPQPEMSLEATLMDAFKERKSTREFSEKELSLQELSGLLWAANGYNRPEEKKRTAPTAMNRQEIDLYVFTKDGIYLYDTATHSLKQVSATDGREYIAAGQDFAKDAPVSLLIVSDMNRFGSNDQNARAMSAADGGMVSQNISLFCAGAGLATVPRGTMNKAKIAELLGLGENHILLLNHPVGHKK